MRPIDHRQPVSNSQSTATVSGSLLLTAMSCSDNTVTNVDVAMACAGQQVPVTPVFSNNAIDGQTKPTARACM